MPCWPGELMGKAYLKNQGLIDTIKQGLSHLMPCEVDGVGGTGSGKEFVKALVGADYIDSEIIAHLVACLQEYPTVRTVLDIGGGRQQTAAYPQWDIGQLPDEQGLRWGYGRHD